MTTNKDMSTKTVKFLLHQYAISINHIDLEHFATMRLPEMVYGQKVRFSQLHRQQHSRHQS